MERHLDDLLDETMRIGDAGILASNGTDQVFIVEREYEDDSFNICQHMDRFEYTDHTFRGTPVQVIDENDDAILLAQGGRELRKSVERSMETLVRSTPSVALKTEAYTHKRQFERRQHIFYCENDSFGSVTRSSLRSALDRALHRIQHRKDERFGSLIPPGIELHDVRRLFTRDKHFLRPCAVEQGPADASKDGRLSRPPLPVQTNCVSCRRSTKNRSGNPLDVAVEAQTGLRSRTVNHDGQSIWSHLHHLGIVYWKSISNSIQTGIHPLRVQATMCSG